MLSDAILDKHLQLGKLRWTRALCSSAVVRMEIQLVVCLGLGLFGVLLLSFVFFLDSGKVLWVGKRRDFNLKANCISGD